MAFSATLETVGRNNPLFLIQKEKTWPPSSSRKCDVPTLYSVMQGKVGIQAVEEMAKALPTPNHCDTMAAATSQLAVLPFPPCALISCICIERSLGQGMPKYCFHL